MKKFLLLIITLIFLPSCSENGNEEAPFVMDNSLFGIEQITLNDTKYALLPNSLLIDKGNNSPLVLIGNSHSLHSVGLDYAWMSQSEKLTYADITSKKGEINVTQTKTSTTVTYTLTVSTTSPKAKMCYTISAHL